MRWITVKETGEKARKEVPVRFRRWWWNAERCKLMLEVRYGDKRLEIEPKKTAIEIGDVSNLLPTLTLRRKAVEAGELDKVFLAAKNERSANFERSGKAA